MDFFLFLSNDWKVVGVSIGRGNRNGLFRSGFPGVGRRFFRGRGARDGEMHCTSFQTLDVADCFHDQGGLSGSGSGPAISLPLHFGQRVMSRPVRRRIFSAVVSLGGSAGSGGGSTSSALRMVLSACFLLGLERKPK